ncbi:PQQ-dependent sugar dehydrogenase [Janibacter alittae]|uniref:PQQ-dependent sugar dehydrogenase n=1 Tax=Janibacter alittae TaxID=3115209 RepID=A0ABZ2MIN0_9MICO
MAGHRRAATAASLLAAGLLAGCTAGGDPPSSATSSTTTADDAQVTTVAAGLDVPWSVAFHDGTPLVSQRDSGDILELDDAGDTRVVGSVRSARARGEGGLLGIAVREDVLYAYLTTDSDNRIVRHDLTGQAGSLGLGDPEVILDGIPAAGVHNGGRIAFGPDGMLYATTGDAGDGDAAQDLDSLSGKILRMTPDGSAPEDNPVDGSLVYSYGHRNPQGIAWDAEGTMYASEFGQNTWDELNLIEAGANYGWPEVEGIGGGDEYVDPVQQWEPAEASPSGLAVADGSIHIANLRGERLREVPLSDPDSSTERLVGECGRLRAVVTTPDGELWVLTNNTDGRGDPGPDDDRILQLRTSS